MTDAVRQVALLRAVNLGPRRRVAMADLRALLAGAGLEDVATYVQSGNAVFTTSRAPDEVARDLERRIAAELGVETDVVIRTHDELADVVAGDPLAGVWDTPKWYQVTFLSAALDATVARDLEAADIAPERCAVRGREIYAWHPEGMQRSKLARAVTDRRLCVVGTARNWTTVTKLLELASG